mgnify:CR=1 FL=1|jgi:hypothetical protein
MNFERHGVRCLAIAVIDQAMTDYRKLKSTKSKMKKLEGGWVLKKVLMDEVEKFFSPEGGADYYLELAGVKIDPALIKQKLKNE